MPNKVSSSATIKGVILSVGEDGDVTMGNGTTLINASDSSEYPAQCRGAVYSKGKLVIQDGTVIKQFKAQWGGGIYIDGGTVEMTGGQITKCGAGYGGGVYVNAGTFTINGNAVIGGDSEADGCDSGYGSGVYVKSGGVFEMEDNSRISYCKPTNSSSQVDGAGVYCAGTFTMTGGEISNNIAGCESYKGNGGGVYLLKDSNSNGLFTMTGGTIGHNTYASNGSGVYVPSGATFKMGDSATVESDNDVYLKDGAVITICEPFEGMSEKATITPENYVDGKTVLVADGVTLEYESTYFLVTPFETTNWSISIEGKLVPQ